MAAFFVLFLFVAALVLFISEKVAVDVVTLMLLAALMLTGILTPAQAFSGFATDVIVILGSISIICAALQKSSVLDFLVAILLRWGGKSPRKLGGVLMAAACSISAFMNNTTVTAMLLPAVDDVAKRSGIGPSRLMMPLAFASILGGTCTLIGTSTNLAVSGYLAKTGFPPLGLFEIAPIGLVIVVIGILYMIFIGCRILPDGEQRMVTPREAMRDYLCEIEVLPNSPLIGEKSFGWELSVVDFRILQVIRQDRTLTAEHALTIQEGDILLVEGKVEDLIRVQKIEGIRIRTQLDVEELVHRRSISIAEALVLPGADVIGETLGEADFRQRFGLFVLAVNHRGKQFVERLANYTLSAGDVLLVKGSQADIHSLRGRDAGLMPLGEPEEAVQTSWRGWFVMGCFAAAILVSTVFDVSLAAGVLTTAILAILTDCISAEKAREAVDWRLLILIGGMTGFGKAMETSGAAQLLANGVVGALGGLGHFGIMAGFFILTVILTQPMSNAAAALVVLPIAISTALQTHADPRTFGIAIMLAASVSFVTPFEPSCLLVYGPGRYRFGDFVRVGGGLTLVLLLVVLPLIPVIWKLS